jgi:hypothetical protein
MTAELPEGDRSLVQRVRKLLDKAENTDNPHEAEAFAGKAADLIARHRIDPARLAERGDAADDLALSELNVGRGAYVRGRISLLANVAEAHDVRMVYQSTPTGSVVFLAGRRQVASQMATLRRSTGAATQRERRAFLFGFAGRIGELLTEVQATATRESQATSDGGAAMAVAVRERRERVDDFADRTWGKVRSAGRAAPLAADGYERGANAANRADVGRTRLGGRPAIGRGKK